LQSGNEQLVSSPIPLEAMLYQDMRWCSHCLAETMFIEVFEFEGGRLGYCFSCGDERVARFTRVTAEEA
jgi:hypothetical protein